VLTGGLIALWAGCGSRPTRVFAVQIASASEVSPVSGPAAPRRALPVSTANLGAGGGRLAASLEAGISPSEPVLRARHPQWDLNHASGAVLAGLPGIQPATLAAILAGRPYRSKRELLKRKIVSASQYARWKDYLVVHRTS